MEWLSAIIKYIGSGLPVCVLCLCLAIILLNKSVTKKLLTSFLLVAVIMFLILLRS